MRNKLQSFFQNGHVNFIRSVVALDTSNGLHGGREPLFYLSEFEFLSPKIKPTTKKKQEEN